MLQLQHSGRILLVARIVLHCHRYRRILSLDFSKSNITAYALVKSQLVVKQYAVELELNTEATYHVH